MAYWLFKEEPTHYSFADLQRDGSAVWDGVRNALARIHLRNVRKGDRILYYHSGQEKAIVGEMRALADAEPDAAAGDPKAVRVRVEAVRVLPHPVPLRRIKEDPALQDWQLVRMSRLSIMPVTAEQWRRVQALSKEKA